MFNELKRKAEDWEGIQRPAKKSAQLSEQPGMYFAMADHPPLANYPALAYCACLGESTAEADLSGTTVEPNDNDKLPSMTNPLVTPSSKFVVDYQGRKRGFMYQHMLKLPAHQCRLSRTVVHMGI